MNAISSNLEKGSRWCGSYHLDFGHDLDLCLQLELNLCSVDVSCMAPPTVLCWHSIGDTTMLHWHSLGGATVLYYCSLGGITVLCNNISLVVGVKSFFKHFFNRICQVAPTAQERTTITLGLILIVLVFTRRCPQRDLSYVEYYLVIISFCCTAAAVPRILWWFIHSFLNTGMLIAERYAEWWVFVVHPFVNFKKFSQQGLWKQTVYM